MLGAGLTLTLALAITTAIEGSPWADSAAASTPSARPSNSYVRLLTAPLRGPAEVPALESAHKTTRSRSPCGHNQARQLVVVSISKQHLWGCSHHRVTISSPVTTGKSLPGDRTPRGSFAVEARVANTTLRPADGGKVHVNYWIPFRQNIWGFHDAPWQTMPFGSSRYRTEGSIGCVHVPINALRELYGWVDTGTTVRIR